MRVWVKEGEIQVSFRGETIGVLVHFVYENQTIVGECLDKVPRRTTCKKEWRD